MTLPQLANRITANDGHLQVALRMFQSLGWITRDGLGAYSVRPEAEAQKEVPEDLLELFDFPIDSYLAGGEEKDNLRAWIDRSTRGWGVKDPLIADFLDGTLAIRVLLAMSNNNLFGGLQEDRLLSFPTVKPEVRQELCDLFEGKGWAIREGDRLLITDVGRFLVDRIMITGVTASYTPMLRRMPDLLFGNSRHVTARNAGGNEVHVDRNLNVVASGFQHEKYFSAIDEIILSVFDALPYERQPKYVADMGCGDGTLLKRIYELIKSHSARGKVLEDHPLTMIGVDYNEEALRATEHTLSGIPSLVLKGDIADPERMVGDLRRKGIEDPGSVLHVRSFLDHDRPFLPPTNLSAVRARSVLPDKGVYVDSDGHAIPGPAAMQSLVEHFQRWSAVVGNHGLIIAEVHCLDPDVVHEFLDRSESLHFDAYHAFSMQHLVEAEVFLMSAAEAGLFPKPDFSKRFPRTFPFSRISINWFEKRPYTIRHAHLDDLPELIRLEEESLPETLRTTHEEIRRRIERFPNGHCVLELEGRIAGAVYSQRISGADVLRNSNVTDNQLSHREDGQVIQLLGINVLPEFQDKGLGDQLLEFMLQWSGLKSGIKSVAGVTRCKDFGHHSPLSMEEYIRLRNDQGDLLDPILRFHENHGARIVECLPNYRPRDKENGGTGVLIGYDIHNRQAARHRSARTDEVSDKARNPEEGSDVRSVVETSIRSLMGRKARSGTAFSPDHSLRELGLDSLDLMELKSLLIDRLGRELDSTFFFKYATPESIFLFYEGGDAEGVQHSGQKTSRISDAVRGESGWDTSSPESRRWLMPPQSRAGKADDRLGQRSSRVGAYSPGITANDAGSAGPIAIIGTSCRFPGGADDADKYWDLLHDGMDAITEVPKARWDIESFSEHDGDSSWMTATRFGGFLNQVDHFDAQFFRIAPVEAEHIDPQQRLLLETTWEALEKAGLNPQALKETQTGVFIGIHTHDYEILQLKKADGDECSPYFATSNSASVAAGRLSYFFGFQGPSISVDTACSSSLTALHLACQSLRQGECDLAIVGGVNLILAPELSVTYSKLGMLSKDGRCKSFDASANGYVRSEGCGIVVLKRFHEAVTDRDGICAVVRGSAVNQDGQSNGLTAPNGFSQEAVIRKALKAAGVLPDDVSYVEAHGTGTPLGDPVEMKALEAVYGRGRRKDQPLIVGSVKTNIGHLEAAAGLAGLIKVVLSFQHDYIPPHLHFRELNPNISLEHFPAVIPSGGIEWKRQAPGKQRFAAVSSFGSSGTNSHVILEEAPMAPASSNAPGLLPQLFVLSAKSEDGLRELARSYDSFLASHPELLLDDVCFTAGAGRAHFEHRLAFVPASIDLLRAQLNDYVLGKKGGDELVSGRAADRPGRGVAFLFTGQGSQYVGMGRDLFENEPRFRETLTRCNEILSAYLERSLLDVLYPDSGTDSPLDQTYYTQPALFALEYAISDLWKSWGIEPGVVMGHSVGEYVAACLAGVFSLEDGLKLIAARARLMQSLPRDGKMVVIFADEARVAPAVEPHAETVSIATINGPTNTVISGQKQTVDAIVARLEAQGLKSFELTVSHAFHSPLMEPMLGEFRKVAEQVRFFPPRIDFISNVTGGLLKDEVAGPDYWCTHVRRAVRFATGMQTLFARGCETFVEIGPKPILLGMGQICLPEGQGGGAHPYLKWLPSLRPGVPDRTQLLRSLAALYVSGQVIDWQGLNHDRQARKVALPTYPWQKKRYWIEAGRKRPDTRGRMGSRASGDDSKDVVMGFHWLPRRHLESGLERGPVTYLPTPDRIASRLAESIQGIEKGGARESIENAPLDFDRLSTGFVINSLVQMKLDLRVGDSFTEEDLADRLGIIDRHRRLFGRMLQMLEQDGLLGRGGSTWTSLQELKRQEVSDLQSAVIKRYPSLKLEIEILERCGKSLGAVMQGKRDPLDVLFLQGASSSVERLYEESAMALLPNLLVRRAISAITESLPGGQTLRMLEIGAGTGGMTSHILPLLPIDRTDYVFTDVSKLFLDKAREKFSRFPFVRYQLLNIEQDPALQGFSRGQFDLVLASNVFHATADLRKSLENARDLLAPGGMILLIEGVRPTRWIDLIFGQLDGWWRFTDSDLRSSYPLLNVETWKDLLRRLSFEDAEAVATGEMAAGRLFEQALIVARSAVETAPAFVPAPGGSQTSGWIVFSDTRGVGQRVAKSVRTRGERCALVFAGDGFKKQEDDAWIIDASCTADYQRLLREIGLEGEHSFTNLVHLWNLDDLTDNTADKAEKLTKDVSLRSSRIIHLLQALSGLGISLKPRFCLVTRGAQTVAGSRDLPSLDQAPLWGIGRTAANEYPDFWGSIIDLDPDTSIDSMADSVADHLLHSDGEDQVAYRKEDRYVGRFLPLVREESQPFSARSDGCYLITGGLGDLGLETARWLVKHGARNIVLLGRTPLPPRSDWDTVSDREGSYRQITAIQEMERAGAKTMAASVDVADEARLRDFLTNDIRAWKPIRGVIHAAGQFTQRLLQNQDEDGFGSDLRAKIGGAWLLHELLKDEPLDFFVLYSSLNSHLGLIGLSSYAASNAFLDAMAQYRRALGLPALCVNWGPWSGLGFLRKVVTERAANTLFEDGFEGTSADSALGALEWLIQQEQVAQAAVARIDGTKLWRTNGPGRRSRLLSELSIPLSVSRFREEMVKKEEDARDPRGSSAPIEIRTLKAESLEEDLKEMLGNILGLEAESIDRNKPVGELGLDSLMAVELKSRCERALGIRLPATVAWNYPTIAALARHLLDMAQPSEGARPETPRSGQGRAFDGDELASGHLISDDVFDEIDQLSEEEAMAKLLGKKSEK